MSRIGRARTMKDMSAHPQVTISTGILKGEADAGIRRFLGIPYAAPPFGANRFHEPQPPAAWEGVRDATAFGPTAPQLPYPGAIGELLGSVRIPGDDILTANVWSPEGAAGAPVVL
jgi:para-nitrobenzyl esterase